MEKPENKGKYLDECYRQACSNSPAEYYNYSTRMHYCKSCAMLINDMNSIDANRMFGHDLCLIVSANMPIE